MEVPINKNKPAVMSDWVENNYKFFVEKNFNKDQIEANIERFQNNDIHNEYKWIKQLIEDLKSPIVFTHNDYRSDNLMVLIDE